MKKITMSIATLILSCGIYMNAQDLDKKQLSEKTYFMKTTPIEYVKTSPVEHVKTSKIEYVKTEQKKYINTTKTK